MGLQHRRRPIFGTQWHPESVCSEHGAKILSNFRDIVLDYWATSRPTNQWTSRSIRPNATLPNHILNADVLLDEAHHSSEPTTLRGVSEGGQNTPYYVASASLGKGPKPELVFQTLIRGSSADGEAWLDSAKVCRCFPCVTHQPSNKALTNITTQVRDSHSRNSYLASAAFSLSYSIELGTVSIHQGGKITKSERLKGTYWHWLDHFQHELVLKNTQAILPESLNQETEVGQPLLQVGLIGYFGYELKWESLPGHRYPDEEVERHDRPDSQLIFADRVLRLDNYTGEWTLFGLIRRSEQDPIGQAIEATSAIGLDEDEFADLVSRFRDAFDGLPSPPHVQPHPLPEFVALDNQDSYTRSIVQAKKAISEGETYELTLTTKFFAKSPDADPFALYLDLRGRNPAPYSAFLHFPAHDTTILSSSPERFISIDRNGVAEMKPIKGTLAVSPDPEEDLRRRNKLATDVKELAENLMVCGKSIQW
jgi:para-aminobenzoate synthetase